MPAASRVTPPRNGGGVEGLRHGERADEAAPGDRTELWAPGQRAFEKLGALPSLAPSSRAAASAAEGEGAGASAAESAAGEGASTPVNRAECPVQPPEPELPPVGRTRRLTRPPRPPPRERPLAGETEAAAPSPLAVGERRQPMYSSSLCGGVATAGGAGIGGASHAPAPPGGGAAALPTAGENGDAGSFSGGVRPGTNGAGDAAAEKEDPEIAAADSSCCEPVELCSAPNRCTPSMRRVSMSESLMPAGYPERQGQNNERDARHKTAKALQRRASLCFAHKER